MTDHLVTLKISDKAYTRAQDLANASTEPLEQILASRLEDSLSNFPLFPADERAELAALHYLSDQTLRTIAAEQMPRVNQERLSLLLALNKRTELSAAEESELNDLLAQGDRLMVRKGQAAAILTQRGYKISLEDMVASRE